jgi:hypothetical protein
MPARFKYKQFCRVSGLGIVVTTIGYKEKTKVSRPDPIQDKQASPIDIVKQMSDNEYTTVIGEENQLFQDAVTKLAETLVRWESLKVNITKQYEQYRVK